MLSEQQKKAALEAWEGNKPKYHKGKSMRDFWTCGNCGAGTEVHDDFCFNCGHRILWDSPRCLTGMKEKQ